MYKRIVSYPMNGELNICVFDTVRNHSNATTSPRRVGPRPNMWRYRPGEESGSDDNSFQKYCVLDWPPTSKSTEWWSWLNWVNCAFLFGGAYCDVERIVSINACVFHFATHFQANWKKFMILSLQLMKKNIETKRLIIPKKMTSLRLRISNNLMSFRQD